MKKERNQKTLLTFLQNHWGILLAAVLSILFITLGILVSLNRFWQYEVYYYDFGIFDMALSNAAQLRAPIIEHLSVNGKWIFADHFNPTLFLLVPFYWLTDRQELLLVIQAVSIGSSGFVLYLIGEKILKRPFYSITILICYFLFVGLQNAVITDFHEVTIALFLFMLTYYFFFAKKRFLFFLSFILFLGCKESNFTFGIGMAISFFLLDRTRIKDAVILGLLSLLWGIVSIHFIIPYFKGGAYSYQLLDTTNPLTLAERFTDNPEKTKTLFMSFLSFGFLPLLAPAFWILIVQDFAGRFLPPFLTESWKLGLHYSALTSGVMSLSSLFGLKWLSEKIKKPYILPIICILLIFNSLVLYRFVLKGPFALAYNPAFYAHSKDFGFLDTLIAHVPQNGSVMTQNNLAPRFTRRDLMFLRKPCDMCSDEYYEMRSPDYLVLDARDGQSPNNYFAATDPRALISLLKKDPRYIVYYQSGDQYIFKKK